MTPFDEKRFPVPFPASRQRRLVLVVWYWKYAPDEISLAVLAMRARAAKKGLWVDPSPVSLWEWRKRGRAMP